MEESTHKLPVRQRHILRPDGVETLDCTVHCPRQHDAVPLSTCADCVRCEWIEVEDQRGKVHCSPAVSEPRPHWIARGQERLAEADKVTLAALMPSEVFCVTSELELETVTALFLERGLGAAPVVNGDGFPIGVISKTDLIGNAGTSVTVADLMTPLAYTLRETDPLSTAAAVMQVERVNHLPVVAKDGRVVGMLSSLDFVRWIASQSAFAELFNDPPDVL